MDVEKDLKTRESTYLLLDLVSTVNDCLILHDKIIYILIDFIFQIVQQSPYLTMDVLESCFPYALLRNAYHEVYKVNCLSVLNAAWFSYCVSCFSSVFPFFLFFFTTLGPSRGSLAPVFSYYREEYYFYVFAFVFPFALTDATCEWICLLVLSCASRVILRLLQFSSLHKGQLLNSNWNSSRRIVFL